MDDHSKSLEDVAKRYQNIIDQQSRQIDADQKAFEKIWDVLDTDWSLTGLDKIQSIIRVHWKSQLD